MSYTPSGIPKFDNLDNIKNIQNSKDGDIVIAKDTGLMYQYKDGSWTTSNNTFTNPSQFSNWVLSDTKTFNNVIPSGSFDISGCNKFRIECETTSTPTGSVTWYFGSDNNNTNYKWQSVQGNNTNATASLGTSLLSLANNNWGSKTTYILEFDKTTKQGFQTIGMYSSSQTISISTISYIGTDSIQSLILNPGSTLFTGIIKIYKWVDQIQPVELSTYELISEIRLNNQTFNDVTIPIDDTIDTLIVDTSLSATSANASVILYINNDRNSNYICQTMYGTSGTTIALSNNTITGITLGNWWSNGTTPYTDCYSKLYLNLQQNNVRGMLTLNCGQYYSGSVQSTIYDSNSKWTGTSKVTNVVISTTVGKTYTGTIRVYKLAKSHLISTNPNLLTIYSKYISNNSIQIQPGEIEINGTICQVSTPTTITLSENLKSGLSETSNTYYYLYAVKSNNRNVTYMFDTIAPTMDRYGNIESTFQDCDLSKAHFHPTLGLNYRYIGQIYNNSSSDILPFSKMKPGYWEGAWTQFSWVYTSPSFKMYHGYGKIPNLYDYVFSSDQINICRHIEYFFNGTGIYGLFPAGANTINSITLSGAGNNNQLGIFNNGSAWVSSGYYKLIIKDV